MSEYEGIIGNVLIIVGVIIMFFSFIWLVVGINDYEINNCIEHGGNPIYSGFGIFDRCIGDKQ